MRHIAISSLSAMLALALPADKAGAEQTGTQGPGTTTETKTETKTEPKPEAKTDKGTEPTPKATATAQDAGMNMAKAAKLSQDALVHINRATFELDSRNNKAAQTALDQAVTILRDLYTSVPEGKVLSDLGPNEPGKPMDLAPILSEVRARSVWMDPEVVAHVEDADRKMKKGETRAAEDKLLMARHHLTADIALLPIEDAYARVQAARAELRDGRADQARRLLRNVPIAMAEVQTTAPLVPVRFNLRAAAAAAESGDWERAKELVDAAKTGLEGVEAGPAQKAFDKELQPIVQQAQKLDQRLEKGQKPRPREMRDLAKKTRSLADTL